MTRQFYVLTDIDAIISCSGVLLQDITSMQVDLKKGAIVKTFTTGNGKVQISGGVITLKIPKTDITEPGTYEVRVTFTDTLGKVRGFVVDPNFMMFI